MIDQLQDTEPRTYTCFCGAELVIEFGETDNWGDKESGVLDDEGWTLQGTQYFCRLHGENES